MYHGESCVSKNVARIDVTERRLEEKRKKRGRTNTRITFVVKHLSMALALSEATWWNDRRINR